MSESSRKDGIRDGLLNQESDLRKLCEISGDYAKGCREGNEERRTMEAREEAREAARDKAREK